MNKNTFFVISGILFLTYLTLSVFFYFDFSNSLQNYNDEVYQSFTTLENLISNLRDEDTQLYKILFSSQYSNSNVDSNFNNSPIDELLNLQNENNLYSQRRIATTIDDYYSLQDLRGEILELHRKEIKEGVDLSYNISILIEDYQIQVNDIISQINENIESNKEKNEELINDLKFKYLVNSLILLSIYLISQISLFFVFKVDSSESIYDRDSKKIIDFIKKEISQGVFPTINDVKIHTNLSHPTIINKLKELEDSGVISIRKKGRNKYLFLK